MMNFPRRLLRRVLGFGPSEHGTSTVEFVLVFPAFMMIFISAFESGMMMVRNVMLERGVDLAVRSLRLGTPVPPSFEEFKQQICDNALVISNCMTVVQVELEPVSTSNWTVLPGDAKCIDQESPIDPVDETTYALGGNDDLMLVRVCALFQPMFPSTTLGMQMPDDGNGNYSLVVTSAFVNEPSR